MKVLVVVAHPDDAELAMGMRIRRYAIDGVDVHVHCLTRGSADPVLADRRVGECRAAGAVLGVAEYTFSEVPDARFVESRGLLNQTLFDLFRVRRPDIVYTHFPRDQHLDHSVTAEEVTVVALREAANLTYFRSPYSVDFEPTLFSLGTEDLLAAKLAALACFGSQAQIDMDVYGQLARVAHRQHIHHRVIERFDPAAVCAEAFVIARRIEFGRPQVPPW